MSYASVLDVSASGMALERLRVDIAALNIANARSSAGPGESGFVPMQVLARSRVAESAAAFAGLLGGVTEAEVRPRALAARLEHDPSHPHADAQGYVRYPDVNPLDEMLTLTLAVRAYEANVRSFEAARSLLLKTLEIGQ